MSDTLDSLFSEDDNKELNTELSTDDSAPTDADPLDLGSELVTDNASTPVNFSQAPIEAVIDENETSVEEFASDQTDSSSEASPDDTSDELIFGEGLSEEPSESLDGLSNAVSDTLGSLFSEEDNSEFSSENSEDKNVNDDTSMGFLEVADDLSADVIDGLAEGVSEEIGDLFAESDPILDEGSDSLIGGLPEEKSSNEPAEFYNVLGDSVEGGDLDMSSLDTDVDNIETNEIVLEEESPLSSTATLAEIYLEQRLYSQALAMYKELLQDEPDNAEVQNRISEIESMQSESESDNPNDGADLDSPPQKKLRP
jgi:hypothetical protein